MVSPAGRESESVEVPEDRSWVIFHLDARARWHDGKRVTVDDVIWSFNTLFENGAPFYRFYYGNVGKVEKLDDNSVKFSFKPGENRELPLILGQLPVLPQHYWKTRDFTKATLEPPLGSGPYRVKEFEANRSVAYERVENYWAKDHPTRIGANNFDILRYEYYRDSTVSLEARLRRRQPAVRRPLQESPGAGAAALVRRRRGYPGTDRAGFPSRPAQHGPYLHSGQSVDKE